MDQPALGRLGLEAEVVTTPTQEEVVDHRVDPLANEAEEAHQAALGGRTQTSGTWRSLGTASTAWLP